MTTNFRPKISSCLLIELSDISLVRRVTSSCFRSSTPSSKLARCFTFVPAKSRWRKGAARFRCGWGPRAAAGHPARCKRQREMTHARTVRIDISDLAAEQHLNHAEIRREFPLSTRAVARAAEQLRALMPNADLLRGKSESSTVLIG